MGWAAEAIYGVGVMQSHGRVRKFGVIGLTTGVVAIAIGPLAGGLGALFVGYGVLIVATAGYLLIGLTVLSGAQRRRQQSTQPTRPARTPDTSRA